MKSEIKIRHNDFSESELEITNLGIKASSIDLSKIPVWIKPEQVRDEIPTLNQYGYMKSEFEYFSNSFLDSCRSAKKPVLEIGTAYGWLTHRALETGATVVAADISKEHLEVLVKDAPKKHMNNLYINKGAFPNEIDFPEESFDRIMASRILHFLDGDTLEIGLDKLHSWLTPNGKLVVTNCSIFHSSVKEKMSEIFKERIANNEKWPGLTTKKDFDPVHDDFSSHFLNTFYKEQLEELLPKHGFKVEQINYFDYPSDPWPDEARAIA